MRQYIPQKDQVPNVYDPRVPEVPKQLEEPMLAILEKLTEHFSVVNYDYDPTVDAISFYYKVKPGRWSIYRCTASMIGDMIDPTAVADFIIKMADINLKE